MVAKLICHHLVICLVRGQIQIKKYPILTKRFNENVSWTEIAISWDPDEFPSLFLARERLLIVEITFWSKKKKKSESTLDGTFLGNQTDPNEIHLKKISLCF